MKVALIQERVDLRRGGAETSTTEMARCLAELGANVTVVCSAADSALRDEASEATGGFSVQALPAAGSSKTARTIAFVAEASRFCHLEGFDIVHAVTPCLSAHVYQPRGGTYIETVTRSIEMAQTAVGRWLKRLGRRLNRRQRFLLLLEQQLLCDRRPPIVAAVSEYVRRQVETGFPGFPRERIRVVFNGVEIDALPDEQAGAARETLRARLRLNSAQPLVLFTAHNFKLKGLAELIRAAATAEARAVGWALVVIGRDDPRRYAALARQLRVAERVHFLGAADSMAELYAAADVLAHPTWYDPCSRVVLEALRIGLPVVTTRCNGAAEAIEPERDGVVLDAPTDAPALAAAVERCLHPEVKNTCRSRAKERGDELSMKRHARELIALYEELKPRG